MADLSEPKLTKAQRNFLEWAEEYTPPTKHAAIHWETCGVGARGAKIRMAERLVEAGLLTFVCMGVNVDDHNEPERPIYAITDKGRALLRVSDAKDGE